MSSEHLPAEQPPEGQFLLYQTEDGQTRIECRFAGETIWLSQSSIAELYQTTKQNVSLHLKNLYEDGELVENRVVKEYLTTGPDGKKYRVNQHTQSRCDRLPRIRRVAGAEPQSHDHGRLDRQAGRLPQTHGSGLQDAGKILHDEAQAKAEAEYETYQQVQSKLPQPVDEHFDQTLEELKRIENRKKEGNRE